MIKERGPEATSLRTDKKQLAYANDFREILREHPGIIRAAIALMDRAIADYNPPDTQCGNIKIKYDRDANQWLMNESEYVQSKDKNNQPIRDDLGRIKYEKVFY